MGDVLNGFNAAASAAGSSASMRRSACCGNSAGSGGGIYNSLSSNPTLVNVTSGARTMPNCSMNW